EACVRIGYFDCFSGASGDMILGALVDAGVELVALQEAIGRLGVPGIRFEAERVRRGAFTGTLVRVSAEEHGHPHRHLPDIRKILEASDLPAGVRADALRIFTRLAEAEAAVHGSAPERVHFHEVGALDAIADIVGAAWGLRRLGLARLHVSPLNLGGGFVEAAHGRMPVPAPGTAALLSGVPAYGSTIQAELTTPTGAAILTTLGTSFGPLPPMRVERVAYGAGQRQLAEQPNLLRLMLGEAQDGLQHDEIMVLEATIDDMNPQFFEPLLDRLFEAEALDAFLAPLIMKKSRPATLLTVLADRAVADRCANVILTHSTTFGVRAYAAGRWKLPRDIIEVSTPFGDVRVKRGFREGALSILSPEYEDCRRVAHAAGVPVHLVYDAARQAGLRSAAPAPCGPGEAGDAPSAG
ncbi:MAG: nickel pincer cofactor biosynthesis protein LarC, partial [Candidatus Methylomirabilales bacterium]